MQSDISDHSPHHDMLLTDFSKGFMYAIHQVYTLVEKHLEHALLKEKLVSFSQFLILISFTCNKEGNVSQTSIAEFLHVTEATVSRHISTLVSLGYLTREEDTANRRKYRIMITKHGTVSLAQAKAVVERELASIFKDITEKDRQISMKSFSTILHQLLSKK